MYEQYYGLRERPFDLSPNPRFLFLSKRHAEALAHLRYGLTGRPGVTVLIGEAGTGKTTLVMAALQPTNGTSPSRKIVRLSNPTLTRTEFYEYLSAGYGFSPAAALSKTRFLEELGESLGSAEQSVTALVVDEAQSLPHELLEEVRLLTNVEGKTGRSLTVILAGQPELAGRLNEERLRQLKQRVALRCELSPLDLQETAAYISTRVRVAGGSPELLFTRDAVALIADYSRGIPRTVSVICDNALVSGFAADLKPVGRDIVLEVCRDFGYGTQAAAIAAVPAPTKRTDARHFAEPAVPASAQVQQEDGQEASLFSTFKRGRRFFIF
jgi:general secretion pathway protein A